MTSPLKAAFGRLGPVRTVDRVPSGSRVVVVLRPRADLAGLATIDAVRALVKRGLTMLRAKRAVEEALDAGRAVIAVPMLEDMAAFARDLEAAGFRVATVRSDLIDIKAMRDRLGLSQEQFALRYGLDVDSVQNWESGRRQPDRAARSYLWVIARLPVEAGEALETVAR